LAFEVVRVASIGRRQTVQLEGTRLQQGLPERHAQGRRQDRQGLRQRLAHGHEGTHHRADLQGQYRNGGSTPRRAGQDPAGLDLHAVERQTANGKRQTIVRYVTLSAIGTADPVTG
jgi:hypothetical protein